MERHDLEQRLRASLDERARDVEPTPALWQRVDERINRRSRWRLAVTALGGAAAVAVAAITVPALLNDSVRVDERPPAIAGPSGDATEPDTPPTNGALAPFMVTSDGARLYLDQFGPTALEIQGFGSTVEPWVVRSLAVQPGSTVDDLTVAVIASIEGDAEVVVHRIVTGQVSETYRLGRAAAAGQPVADPTVAWSDDGRFLSWTSFVDGAGSTDPTLRMLTWARALDLTANGADPAARDGQTIASIAGIVPLQSDTLDVTQLRLQSWTGPTATLDDESALWFTTSGAQAASMRIALNAPGACIEPDGTTIIDDPTCPQVTPIADVEERSFEAGAIADIGFEPSGRSYVLAVRSDSGQDAEGATLTLQMEPDSDDQRRIALPDEFAAGTASPGDAWLDVIPGGPLVVGFGADTWVLEIPDGAIESTPRGELIQPRTTRLPGIVAVAGGHPGLVTPSEPSETSS